MNEEMTLREAKEYLDAHIEAGVKCPCCGQFAKIYRWSLYSTAVKALILYYRIGRTRRFVHSNRLKDHNYKGQGDASRLQNWGLVEGEKTLRPDGGRSGYWRVTDLGERFLKGAASIPKYIYVFDGQVIDYSPEAVMLADVVGNRFNYDQMMHWNKEST